MEEIHRARYGEGLLVGEELQYAGISMLNNWKLPKCSCSRGFIELNFQPPLQREGAA